MTWTNFDQCSNERMNKPKKLVLFNQTCQSNMHNNKNEHSSGASCSGCATFIYSAEVSFPRFVFLLSKKVSGIRQTSDSVNIFSS